MFDEPHLGMDAPNRYDFYDELLADYAAHPRTIVLATHLIERRRRVALKGQPSAPATSMARWRRF